LVRDLNNKGLSWVLEQKVSTPDSAYEFAYFKNLKTIFESTSDFLTNNSGISIENKRAEYKLLDEISTEVTL
jgi:hypothetical protein